MKRRLLTYLCIDTSGSMNGEPIVAVNSGLQALLSALRGNPYAMDNTSLSITTFNSEVTDIMPMTEIADITLPEIVCPQSGATMLGEALEHIHSRVQVEVNKGSAAGKGDWRPMLVLLTDGKPTDVLAYSQVIPKIKGDGFGTIIACAAGPKADSEQLKRLTDTVVSLDTMDAAGFNKFFAWISDTFAQNSQSQGAAASVSLPPPPPEVNVVL